MLKKLTKNENSDKLNIAFILIVATIGIILRFRQFLFNRTMWVDECLMAKSISSYSLFELLNTKIHDEIISPLGFLAIEKLFHTFIGNMEYAIRTFPFICGLLSFYFFYRLACLLQEKKGVLISLLLFSISPPLIYYSSEGKQYSLDALLCILLLYLAIKFYLEEENIKKNLTSLIATSSLSIWLSYTSPIVLTAITISLFIMLLSTQKKKKLHYLFYITLCWLFSFFIHYLVIIYDHLGNSVLHNYWGWAYISLNDPSKNSIIFNHLLWFLQFKYLYLILLCFLIGIISFWHRNKIAIIVASPILITIVLSILRQYPFGERVIIFIIPLFFIFISQGITEALNTKEKYLTFWGVLLLIFTIYHPLKASINTYTTPTKRFDIASTLKYVSENIKKDDVIYLHFFSQRQYEFYADKYGLNNNIPTISLNKLTYNPEEVFYKNRWVEKDGFNKIFLGRTTRFCGTNTKKHLKYELDLLKESKRVWFVFSHTAREEIPPFISYINQHGEKIDYFRSKGEGFFSRRKPFKSEDAIVYLYELN